MTNATTPDAAAHEAALKEKVAFSSIIVSAVMTLGKLAAGVASGSLALMSEGAHNAIDTGATLLTYFAVRQANKPADARYNYGRGKAESLSALAETGLLAGLALYVVVTAVRHLMEAPEPVDASWPVFAVLIVSIAVDVTRVITLRRVAKKTGSHALAADALHFASDMVGTVLVLIGLIADSFGFHQGDALAAIGVAVFISIAGYHLGSETLATLLDAAPEGLADDLRSAILEVPGVVAVESLKLRVNGAQVLGETMVAVSRLLPVERIDAIRSAVEQKIAAVSPETRLTISMSPRALDDETISQRIMMVAARQNLSAHHIMVQHLHGRASATFDLELDGAMPHGVAHEVASALEDEIRAELGADFEVESHIEPSRDLPLFGVDAEEALKERVTQSLNEIAREGGVLDAVHDVRARRTEEGLVVNFHALVDPTLSVAMTHEAVDQLERAFRARTPGLLRVVGHAEPRNASVEA